MPSKKGILKPCEELRMKREVEAILMKSKMEYQQMKTMLQKQSTSITLPSDICHLQGSADQVPAPSGDAHRPPPNPQEPASPMSPGLMEFRQDLLLSPPSSVHSPDKNTSASQGQESMHQISANPPVNTPDRPVVFKSAIAQLIGTTKAVSMSQRPQPPLKPRSARPSSGPKVQKTFIRSGQAPTPGTRVAAPRVPRNVFWCSNPTLSSDNSSESNSSDDSGSDQSSRAQRKGWRRIRRIVRPVRPTKLTSENKTPLSQKGKLPVIPHKVKSATELLEEARNITGMGSESQDEVEDTMATAKHLVRTGRRTVDEIIASLQNETVDVSASDHMIKELMKQVLGDGYSADNEVSNVEM